MKINKKIYSSAIILAGITGLLASSPIYADYSHHDWRHHDYQQDGYYHHGGNAAAGIFVGAAVGLLAAAAMTHPYHHYDHCRRVYYSHYCRHDHWGTRCYTIRHVRYVC